MAAIPVRELSHHTAQALARVKAGESLEITERGRVIGRIVPVDPQSDARTRLAAQGRLRPSSVEIRALLSNLAERIELQPVDTSAAASAALHDLRDSERY